MEPFLTPLNILFIVLSIAVFLVTIFICMALYHAIQIMRDVQKVTDKAKETVEQVNEYIAKPISVILEVVDQVRNVMGFVEEHKPKKKSKKK